jgi:hypothetical protein
LATALDTLDTQCSWQGEAKAVGEPKRAGIRKRSKTGRIDWVLEAGEDGKKPQFLLGVEVNIEASLTNPLESYYDQLQRAEAGAWGLLLLVRNRPPEDELLDPERHAQWLGVALWGDVIDKMNAIHPRDPALAAVWPSLLTILSDDDDLGAAPITLASLVGTRRKNRLTILAEHAQDAVEKTAKAALRPRRYWVWRLLLTSSDPQHRPVRDGSFDKCLTKVASPGPPAWRFAVIVRRATTSPRTAAASRGLNLNDCGRHRSPSREGCVHSESDTPHGFTSLGPMSCHRSSARQAAASRRRASRPAVMSPSNLLSASVASATRPVASGA